MQVIAVADTVQTGMVADPRVWIMQLGSFVYVREKVIVQVVPLFPVVTMPAESLELVPTVGLVPQLESVGAVPERLVCPHIV